MTRIGILNDEDIISYGNKNILISEEFEVKNVKQACYELRASNIYYDISNQQEKYELQEKDYILIKPKQTVVIITKETLNLPNNILGRILTKGKFFSIGILPVNTYADPGFRGQIGIVFSNISNNYLKIMPEERIVKMEFTKLEKEVTEPYSGQHGYETGFWPYLKDYVLSPEEIKRDQRIKSLEEEIELSYGKKFVKVIQRVQKYEHRFLLTTIIYVIITSILMALSYGTNILSAFLTIVLGVLTNVMYGGTVYFINRNKD